jgi:hypothetical protein
LPFVALSLAVFFAWPHCVERLMNAGERFGARLGMLRVNDPHAAQAPVVQPWNPVTPPGSPALASEQPEAPGKVSPATATRKRLSLRSIRVPAETVLKWIELRRVPKGRSVTASGARPSGIELSGVSAFAAGVEDGDVLFDVNGKPVASHDDVVASVLAAQSARAPTVSGQFWRGGEVFRVTVELPYLDSSGKLQHDYANVANGQLH